MRRPAEVERLYLDFDGFFASVEQLAKPSLRGRPVGVVPFAGTDRTCIIACSREAKLLGVKNVMSVPEAQRICPGLVLVSQSPDLYRRAHNALLSEISAVLPIDAVKSIDELTCRVQPSDRAAPLLLGERIKKRIHDNLGPTITCSIGFAANRQLAKMACKAGKKTGGEKYGDGNMVWHPANMPGPLLAMKLSDVPGIGHSMEMRLLRVGINSIEGLLAAQPKFLRKVWNNVSGERLWYALQGYDVQTPPSGRSMYGHGRVLPPESRSVKDAKAASRLLLVKAARRMRRDQWNAGGVSLYLAMRGKSWGANTWLPAVHDDHAILAALERLWADAPPRAWIIQVHVTLTDLTPAAERQLDILLNDEGQRKKAERVTDAIDSLNRRYGKTLVHIGEWIPPGEFAGGKISYTRIPNAEDFW
ncbi:MAG: type VI secretion protein ImpB [Pseudonocardiaceae bacterium]|nr:MAG: type VI secretion protein ImpB [Pseudonocardiaceae bacterium]